MEQRQTTRWDYETALTKHFSEHWLALNRNQRDEDGKKKQNHTQNVCINDETMVESSSDRPPLTSFV